MTQLANLPTEIIECICCYLSRDRVLKLRLSCRELAAKASQGQFRRYFRKKSIQLNDHQLQTFADVTRDGKLGCLLEELTIDGRADDVAIWPLFPREHVSELLREAFRNLKASSRSRKRLSINIGVKTTHMEGFDHRLRYDIAKQIFATTMQALSESGLPITMLDLFGTHGDCSIPFDAFVLLFTLHGLSNSLSTLRQLKVRITQGEEAFAHENVTMGFRYRDETTTRLAKVYVRCMAHFLELMPRLSVFDVHFHRPCSGSAAGTIEKHFLDAVHQSLQAAPLTSIILRGLYLSEETLLTFLRQHSPSMHEVILREIKLHTGTFRSIVEHLTRSATGLAHLDLKDLFDCDNKVIRFRTPSISGPDSTQLQRSGSNVQAAIKYTQAPEPPWDF